MPGPLSNKFPFTAAQWLQYKNYFKRITVPSKTVLLNEGAVSKKLYLIEKGCIRVWFNNNGRDITFQFFFENDTVASIESFRKKIPSLVTIETIEPSTLWWIYKKDMDRIIEEVLTTPALRDQFINAVFERTFDYMKHFFSFIRNTPEQRYTHLLNERPQLIQRVPQHYIASYLGITPVHLSRIKNKLAKNKPPR
ncbi:cyclic nucleotide-binding protein [Niabella ginsenosidivorans]|uniref:Cyclic nucleotide-binding protein n=1 Tax=Niabella ginsenosidivorans TaxID=1176587 RepID=A0A1A9I430_9BACT|nr:Crp/Fnr family transcriptional regulator [Niabella ginsenosidivorans]ANH82303.1 cyclic nucleotide-binding protein [Niabella ginsenosidivorans]